VKDGLQQPYSSASGLTICAARAVAAIAASFF
jgi:hypothetical protein